MTSTSPENSGPLPVQALSYAVLSSNDIAVSFVRVFALTAIGAAIFSLLHAGGRIFVAVVSPQANMVGFGIGPHFMRPVEIGIFGCVLIEIGTNLATIVGAKGLLSLRAWSIDVLLGTTIIRAVSGTVLTVAMQVAQYTKPGYAGFYAGPLGGAYAMMTTSAVAAWLIGSAFEIWILTRPWMRQLVNRS